MNKEQLAEQWVFKKYHPLSENRPKAKEAFIAGYEAKKAEDQQEINRLNKLFDEQLKETVRLLKKTHVFVAEDKWISVETEMPNTGKRYLFFSGGLEIILFYQEEGMLFHGENKWCSPITHWMPLPKSPLPSPPKQ